MSRLEDLAGRLDLGWRRGLPMILQTEASECGLASLAMILHHFGQRADLTDLRRRHGFSLKGATLKELMRTADKLGLASRPLRLEMAELPELRLPCILHWDLNHFVVLERLTRTGAVIHDPAVGVRRLSLTVVSKHFTGVALELMPTESFAAAEAKPRIRSSQLLGRMVGVRGAIANLLGLALAIEVVAMMGPLLLGWVIDHVLVSSDRNLLVTLALGFALLLLVQTAIQAARGWMTISLGASLVIQSRANLFTHLLNLPVPFFDARHLGDVMSRFSSQDTILKAITSELVEAVLDGLMAGLTLLIMFVLAPKLAWVVTVGALLYGALRFAAYAPLRRASMEEIVWDARRDTHFLETLRGVRTIKLFNAQDQRRANWLNLLVEALNRRIMTEKLALLFRTANTTLLGSVRILVILLGALTVMDGSFSVGLLIAFIGYKEQFLQRVSLLINKAVDLSMLRLHGERLADIALTEPEPRSSTPFASELRSAPVSIELRGVSFRYADQEPLVLDRVDLHIKAGESVAITGPSGCGKTTLFKLLAGLAQPTNGDILVNGEPIGRIGLENYRNILGVVMQDDQLFAGSIADNINFFADHPDMDRMTACASVAAIHHDIMAMPMGYGTLIGDMGTILSGGQKQRVLIARALYRRPGLLLLDEATSHLDVERERAVNAAMRAERMTRIMIAHRPETIRSADRIIALDQGGVVSSTRLRENELVG